MLKTMWASTSSAAPCEPASERTFTTRVEERQNGDTSRQPDQKIADCHPERHSPVVGRRNDWRNRTSEIGAKHQCDAPSVGIGSVACPSSDSA